MKILSITSHVCFGHVGAQASVLPLQRLGHDVCHVPTVLLSNHPGYGGFGGGPVKLVRLADLIDSLLARDLLRDCAAVHTGYMGQPGAAASAIRAIDAVRSADPEAIYLCDPVLGDDGRLYVDERIVAEMRDGFVPRADVMTPNAFELSRLTDLPCDSVEAALDACHALRELGPRLVVGTTAAESGRDLILLAVDDVGPMRLVLPRLDPAPRGTGDAFAAILLAHLLNGEAVETALAASAATVHGMIKASIAAGSSELDVVGAQEEVVMPTTCFSVERL